MKDKLKCKTGWLGLLAVVVVWALGLPVKAQSTQVAFRWTIQNSIGEPQKDIYLQIKGYSQKYEADGEGVIAFESNISKNYERQAQLFFKNNTERPVKTLVLKEEQKELTLYINSNDDLLRLKQENKPVEIEGLLQDEAGEPIEGATVSILGTGNQTQSDEIGLFHIATDYNHRIMIRARGMETRTMTVDAFLRNEEEAMVVTLKGRNTDYIYSIADEMPVYRGGMKYFASYLKHVAPYPKEMEKTGVEGVVVVQFVVEKDGSISQPRIVRRLHPELDTLALSAIEHSPRWVPAKDAGKTVRCRYSMPVSFKIPVPEPVKPVNTVQDNIAADSLRRDSIRLDSLRMDSLRTDSLKRDSLRLDTLRRDSIRLDSLRLDSLKQDSLRLDSLKQAQLNTPKKVKKQPGAFIRFFRRLFGIRRDDEATQEVRTKVPQSGQKSKSERRKRKRQQADGKEIKVEEAPEHVAEEGPEAKKEGEATTQPGEEASAPAHVTEAANGLAGQTK